MLDPGGRSVKLPKCGDRSGLSREMREGMWCGRQADHGLWLLRRLHLKNGLVKDKRL